MVRSILPISLFVLGVGCSVPAAEPVSTNTAAASIPAVQARQDSLPEQQPTGWRILPHDPTTLVLGASDTLRTGLSDLRFLMEINAPSGMTWSLLQGRGAAKGGQAELSLFILCTDPSLSTEAIQQPWHMPGRISDGPGDENYYEAEVFVGEVLRDTIGVIWYDRSLMPDGHWKQNTVLLNLNEGMPDTLVLFGHGRKSSTISQAIRGKCELLKGLDQHIKH